MSMARVCPLFLLLLIFPPGCAADPVPAEADRAPSYALAEPGSTGLGRMLARHRPEGEARSGFSLVEAGPEAFASIRSLILLAEKTLDLQYYIWRNDDSGRRLLLDLLDAADRGVRIRLLLDDMEKEWTDNELARLNDHPNFEVRLFNPFSRTTGRWVDALVDFQRVTHRMHNKIIIADNTVAVTGGRNIGNSYFFLDEESSFRDLDLHAAGPVVRELSGSFDAFWNSFWSVSIETLDESPQLLPEVRRVLAKLKEAAPGGGPPQEKDMSVDAREHLAGVLADFTWESDAVVLADAPDKAQTDTSKLLRELAAKMPSPTKELVIESAFFIPGEKGVEALCRLVRSGVRVRVLTNSLASIDAITAYAGYRKYRPEILRCGVQLHELRPRGAVTPKEWTSFQGESSSILHTKAALVDDRHVFIGSFNFDPRSIYLNTEIAVLVRSSKLAKATARFIEEGMSLESSWRLTLENDEIVWHTIEDGGKVRLTEEPGATFWGQLLSRLIGLLPIERQL